MRATDDSIRVLRTAAWIQLGFLIGMALMDFALYTPQIQRLFEVGARIQLQPLPPRPANPALLLLPLPPVYLFYLLNGTAALLLLIVSYWNCLQEQLGEMFYPLMLALLSTTPIFISAFVVPRFPPIPLASAEGIMLRLEDLGLSPALYPIPNLSPDVEQCIYCVAQEAIENVVHHANAKKVSLKLEQHGEHIRLIVQDDGLGFDPHDKVSTGHFGLVGMRERAQLAGGKLTIES